MTEQAQLLTARDHHEGALRSRSETRGVTTVVPGAASMRHEGAYETCAADECRAARDPARVVCLFEVESFPQNSDYPDRDTPRILRRHYVGTSPTGAYPLPKTLCGRPWRSVHAFSLFRDDLERSLGGIDEERACEVCVRRIGDDTTSEEARP